MQSVSWWRARTVIGRRNFLRFSYARTRTWTEFSVPQMRFSAMTTTLLSRRCWVKSCIFVARAIIRFTSVPVTTSILMLVCLVITRTTWTMFGEYVDMILNMIFFENWYSLSYSGTCEKTISECEFNGKKFDCCKNFIKIDTEIGRCYGLNSAQTVKPKGFKMFPMLSDQTTGPGMLRIKVLTECFLYTMGFYEVPNLVTPKTDILQIDQFIHYTWATLPTNSIFIFLHSTLTLFYGSLFSIFSRVLNVKYVENDGQAKELSIRQRNCRFPYENYVEVHPYFSYSACSVQCRLDEQRRLCNCSSHIMPNTDVSELQIDTRQRSNDKIKSIILLSLNISLCLQPSKHCDINGLVCLNEHYEDLSIVIAPWSKLRKRKGLVCHCIPSCEEVDILVTHESRKNILNGGPKPYSYIDVSLGYLPNERYKRNVVRGHFDLVGEFPPSDWFFCVAML